MLDAIRRRSASFLVKFLFAFLILTFVVWGIGDVVRRGATVTEVATVGEVEIAAEQLREEFQRELKRLQPLFGGRLDAEQARAMGLVNGVLSAIIDRTLLGLAAEDLGIAVSDALLNRQIRNNPAFLDTLGNFDRAQYQQVLRSNSLTEKLYENRVRADMARGQLLEPIEAGGRVPAVMLDPIFRHRQEKRVAEVFHLAEAAMPDTGEPDGEALAKFHQDNARLFTAPEYRALTAVSLEVDEFAREIAVPEGRLREAFEERREEFGRPERRQLLQMVLADEAAAKRAEEMLKEGGDFADVAKEVAGQAGDTVDLGLLGRNEILPELADAAFSLEVGAVSRPLTSPLGWHLLKVTAVEAARQPTFEEARVTLAPSIAREMAIDSLYGLANKLEDAVAGGATLEEAARRFNLKLLKIAAIDASGRDRDGQPVDPLPPGSQFLNTAFATAESRESTLTESGGEGYFIVRVDGVTPPALRPLETVRDSVAAAWKAERRREAAKRAAEAILERLQGGADAAQAAAGTPATVAVSEPFTRAGEGAPRNLPPALIAALFKKAPREAAIEAGDDGYHVARLNEIRPADPAADKLGVDRLGRELARGIGVDLVAQLTGALRQRFPVSVNNRALEQLF